MTPDLRRAADQLERSGYLPALRDIARASCAPFWWHGRDTADGKHQILHNGTVCFVRTRTRLFAVTARHVFEQYVRDLASDSDLHCQFGSSTVQPERRLIAESSELDLVTFDVSDVQAAAIRVAPHAPPAWPTGPVHHEEVLLYGGFPGSLREEGDQTADISFQWFVGPPLSITSSYIKLRIDFETFHQPLGGFTLINTILGGLSGGPVFRFVPAPIERLELVGFITEWQSELGLVYARPAHCVTPDGALDHDAAA